MLNFMKKLLLFRIGQKATRGVAHRIGLHGIAGVAGLVGGLKYMRRHS